MTFQVSLYCIIMHALSIQQCSWSDDRYETSIKAHSKIIAFRKRTKVHWWVTATSFKELKSILSKISQRYYGQQFWNPTRTVNNTQLIATMYSMMISVAFINNAQSKCLVGDQFLFHLCEFLLKVFWCCNTCDFNVFFDCLSTSGAVNAIWGGGQQYHFEGQSWFFTLWSFCFHWLAIHRGASVHICGLYSKKIKSQIVGQWTSGLTLVLRTYNTGAKASDWTTGASWESPLMIVGST